MFLFIYCLPTLQTWHIAGTQWTFADILHQWINFLNRKSEFWEVELLKEALKPKVQCWVFSWPSCLCGPVCPRPYALHCKSWFSLVCWGRYVPSEHCRQMQQTLIPSACLTFTPGQALGSRYQAKGRGLLPSAKGSLLCLAANAWDLACEGICCGCGFELSDSCWKHWE